MWQCVCSEHRQYIQNCEKVVRNDDKGGDIRFLENGTVLLQSLFLLATGLSGVDTSASHSKASDLSLFDLAHEIIKHLKEYE